MYRTWLLWLTQTSKSTVHLCPNAFKWIMALLSHFIFMRFSRSRIVFLFGFDWVLFCRGRNYILEICESCKVQKPSKNLKWSLGKSEMFLEILCKCPREHFWSLQNLSESQWKSKGLLLKLQYSFKSIQFHSIKSLKIIIHFQSFVCAHVHFLCFCSYTRASPLTETTRHAGFLNID